MSRPRSRKQFTPFTLDNAWIIEFPVEKGGTLRLGPGRLNVSARLSVCHHSSDGWQMVVECDLRVADREGRLWEAASCFDPGWLLDGLIDLSRGQPARWLRKGPESWRQAFKERALIRKLTDTQDDNFLRCYWIDGTAIPTRFKYMDLGFDVAVLGSDRLVVRVANLLGAPNPMPLEAPDGRPLPLPPRPRPEKAAAVKRQREDDEYRDFDPMPPLAYEIEAGKVLFHNTAKQTEEGWTELSTPLPLTFRPASGQGEPQQAVTFLPGRNPTVLPVSEPPDTPFVELHWQAWTGSELLTDCGGVLQLPAFAEPTWWMRLEKVPGSEHEPVDVLCWRSRLADSAGDLWEGCAVFTPDVFLASLEDLGSYDSPGFMKAEFAVGTPCVLGIRGLIADGAWRYVLLRDEVIAFCGDQKFTVDVALAGRELEVRLAGLGGRRRPIEINYNLQSVVLDPAERAAELVRWQDDRPLPPLLFKMDFRKLAFHNTSFAVDDGFWHGNGIPIPVVFRRVGKTEPVPDVRFVLDPGTR